MTIEKIKTEKDFDEYCRNNRICSECEVFVKVKNGGRCWDNPKDMIEKILVYNRKKKLAKLLC